MAKRVLIVDDERDIRQLLKLQLEDHMSCHITEASNGSEALKQCVENEFDLILTDFKMPEMDGGNLIQHIKTHPNKNKNTPILIISAYIGTAKLNVKGFEGITYLEKPTALAVLTQNIDEILKPA